MRTRLVTESRDFTGKIPCLPAITIVMPYNPKMDSSKHLHECIANTRRQINDLVLNKYEDDLGILVLQKLDKVFSNLTTSTLAESVAIFLSPVFEKVLYLNYPVEPFIGIDDNFSIRQAVLNQQKVFNYMVLDLTFGNGRLCIGNSKNIMVLKSNCANYTKNAESFAKIDKELKMFMDSCSVPVFVTGSSSQLSYFYENTQNSRYIVRYIREETQMRLENLLSRIKLYFTGWETILDQFDMNQVKVAAQEGTLSCGIAEVIKSAKNRKPIRLFIDEAFARNYKISNTPTRTSDDKYSNRYSYLENNLDELIQAVLLAGGKVTFVKGGIWDGFHQIFMIHE